MVLTLRRNGAVHGMEVEVRRKNGELRQVLMSAELLKVAGKECMLSMAVDISDRIQAEKKLLDISLRNEALLDAVPDIVMEVNVNKTYTWANKAGLEFFGEDVIGKEAEYYFKEKQDTYQQVQPLFDGQAKVVYLESWQRRRDGKSRLLAWWCRAMIDGQGHVTGALSSARDITEQRKVEEKVRASLLEKEILLKEIHHRVKNNLQVISGLLTLQAEKIDDPRLTGIIHESQSRIWTMALIHQTLYQSGNLAEIDISDFIRALTGNLLGALVQANVLPTIQFHLIPIRLTIDKAIPLALIVNELLTNAIKHAFPKGRPGTISISLQKYLGSARRGPISDTEITPKEGTVLKTYSHELAVADDGAGLPEDFEISRQKSLGLQLVAMLTKQLGGSFSHTNQAGTIFSILFSADEKRENQA
jgi:PAS domain S-box-containing protein